MVISIAIASVVVLVGLVESRETRVDFAIAVGMVEVGGVAEDATCLVIAVIFGVAAAVVGSVAICEIRERPS